MIQRAIADSDEEASDDNPVGIIDSHDQGRPSGSDMQRDVHAATSTGSTERLRRQLDSVERGFWMNSAPQDITNHDSLEMASPAAQAGIKRRHTATFQSEADAAPKSSIKRAKTTNSSSLAQGHIAKDPAARSCTSTLQTARLTEHSETNSSALLPHGSLQEDFLSHEPSVMFPHSGSTVVDDSSAQRQMLEAMHENNRPLLDSSVINALPSNGQQDSSLPWSVFDSNGRSGSSGEQQRPAAETAHERSCADQEAVIVNGLSSDERRVAPREQVEDNIQVSLCIERASKNTISPMVEIRQPARRASVSSRTSTASSPTNSKRRKKKVEEERFSSDQLNSDERAIGLPKELYQPRPTKRRATAVLEEPTDFSIRPEKAAKVKRTKTADAVNTRTSEEEISLTQKIIAALAPGASQTRKAPELTSHEASLYAEESALQTGESHSISEATNEPPTPKVPKADAEVKHIETSSTIEPMLAKKKSSKKAKRAQTTIFEDHVEFVGSQRSPNLSQQQATRKAVLKAANNSISKRKSKTVVSDDEDDEDTFAVPEVEEQEGVNPPFKKRGRGRPPKTTAKPPQKSAEKVLEESEPESATGAVCHEEVKSTNQAPALGTVPKNASRDDAEEAETPEVAHDASSQMPSKPQVGGGKKTSQTAEPTAIHQSTPAVASIPTPSPEKENDPPPLHEPPKGSPTSHSPIKGSSKVPLRVGLSKRQRIPSLLRVMKPPKQ